MARQTGPYRFQGTLDGYTGYRVNGEDFVKRKSRISKYRIMNSPQFEKTRQNASWFAEAQKIAGLAYSHIPEELRDHKKVWYPLRNKTQQLVREGKELEEIIDLLDEFLTELLQWGKEAKEEVEEEVEVERKDKGRAKEEVKHGIELGRYYGRVDNLQLMDQLNAYTSVINKLLRNPKETGEKLLSLNREPVLKETLRRRR